MRRDLRTIVLFAASLLREFRWTLTLLFGAELLLGTLYAITPHVALEKEATGRFLNDAKATGVPVLVRDMKEDQALVDAGVPFARAIINATNDDMANLEVALDARRLNPKIRIIMRLFDQQIADKF